MPRADLSSTLLWVPLVATVACGGNGTQPAASTGDAGGVTDVDAESSALTDAGGAEASGDVAPGSDAAGVSAPSDGGRTAPSDAGPTWWKPGTGELPWQWELDHEIVTSDANDIGTGDKTYTGAAAADPVVYDIDGFDNTAADVAALHALGKKVICYIEVGAAEQERSDYSQFPTADLGAVISGYSDEKYLNINDVAVMHVIEARILMCSQKGFDGIEPDIDDSYTDPTGFGVTEGQNIAYLATLSDYAHSLGLAWGLKNGGDGGDPSTFVAQMLPHVDFAVVEEPFYLKTIGYFSPTFYDAGKAMFVAEYTNDTSSAGSFCPQAITDHTNAVLFDVGLDGMVRDPCQ
jgi:hypothetical protein